MSQSKPAIDFDYLVFELNKLINYGVVAKPPYCINKKCINQKNLMSLSTRICNYPCSSKWK